MLQLSEAAMQPVVFTIRYSVLLTRGQPFRLFQDKIDFQDYKRKLFDPKRMEAHHKLFSEITVPSLAAQEGSGHGSTAAFVLISTETPAEYIRTLEDTLSGHRWAKVVPVSPDEALPHSRCITSHMQELGIERGVYAHARIDDDDAISNDFTRRLRQYTRPEMVGFAVSFGLGYGGVYDHAEGKFSCMFIRRRPFTALGLAVIGKYDGEGAPPLNVYGLGNHTRIDTRVPVIVDCRAPAYIRTYYPEQDTQQRGLPRGEPVAPNDVCSNFAVAADILPTAQESASFLDNVRAKDEALLEPGGSGVSEEDHA